MLKVETIRSAPKALLHDHLDGGLRPETVIEVAAEVGYRELPTDDPAELAQWFLRGAGRFSQWDRSASFRIGRRPASGAP